MLRIILNQQKEGYQCQEYKKKRMSEEYKITLEGQTFIIKYKKRHKGIDQQRKNIKKNKNKVWKENVRKNQKKKKKREEYLELMKSSIQMNRTKNYDQVKRNKQKNEMNIKIMKQLEYQCKKQQKMRINEVQQLIRKNVKQFGVKKIQNIKQNRDAQINCIGEQVKKRQNIIISLSKSQQQLMKRNSESKVIFEETKKELKRIRRQLSKQGNKSMQITHNYHLKFELPDIIQKRKRKMFS